jgi:superfamily II DNA or RNA helicase
MKSPPTIVPFLRGPLSDRYGGSEAIRQAALACFAVDNESPENFLPKKGRSVEAFSLLAPRPLFSYQQEIVDKLDRWLTQGEHKQAALVSLPTGGGKTRVGAWFLKAHYELGDFKRMLWVAPSAELVDQAVETLRAIWSHFPGTASIDVSLNEIPSGGIRSKGHVSFVTAQLAAKRINELERYGADVLIFDEAHQAVARTFHNVVRAQLVAGGRVVGLSATPGRATVEEGTDLQEIFGNNLITSMELGNEPVVELRERGVLSKLQMHLIELPVQWDQIRVKNLQKRTLSIDELAAHPARFWATVEAICNLPRRSQALAFGASLAHCFALNGALRDRGLRAETLSHNTPAERRASILARFDAGEIDVLLNKWLLATGYDCPGITDVVLASPIRSSILWEQILGRASRGPAVGGTELGRIWELDDHRKLHGRVMSYARFLGDLWS